MRASVCATLQVVWPSWRWGKACRTHPSLQACTLKLLEALPAVNAKLRRLCCNDMLAVQAPLRHGESPFADTVVHQSLILCAFSAHDCTATGDLVLGRTTVYPLCLSAHLPWLNPTPLSRAQPERLTARGKQCNGRALVRLVQGAGVCHAEQHALLLQSQSPKFAQGNGHRVCSQACVTASGHRLTQESAQLSQNQDYH